MLGVSRPASGHQESEEPGPYIVVQVQEMAVAVAAELLREIGHFPVTGQADHPGEVRIPAQQR